MNRREFLSLGALGVVLPLAGEIRTSRFAPFKADGLEPRPDFWKVRPTEIMARCEAATKCSRREIICRTPLGYPVYALFYGTFDDAPPQSNWSAGQASTTYRSYYGSRDDGVQTFLFVAGIHGAEQENVAAAMNLIQMLETGRDDRGREDPELVSLISRYRFIVVPCVNMDGRSISPDHLRGVDFTTFRAASQGVWQDGSLIGWRGSKDWFPLPLSRVKYPGGYPNGDGYNIQHDAAPGDIRTEEAKALLRLCARWRVDAVLNGHSYEFAPSVLSPSAIGRPEDVAREIVIRERINRALLACGLRASPVKNADKATGGININTLFSLASGALALTLENSVSYDRPRKENAPAPTRQYTFDELMQPTFVALREYLKDGLERPFVRRGRS